MFPNNKSFRSQSFVLSAPEINLSPTALTMLTRVSVQFLFDSCLIPVHSAFNPHSIPVQSLSKSCRIFCLPPVKISIFSSISSRKHFSFSLSRQIPFSLSPINFPYNIIMCPFSSLPSLPPSSCIKILLSLSPLRFYSIFFQKNPLLYLSLIS